MPIQSNQISDKPIVQGAVAVAPITGAGKGAFYPKDIGAGQIEGFWVDEAGIETQITENGSVKGAGGGGGGSVSDIAFPSGWDGDATGAPSRNAVFDKISAMDTAISGKQATLSIPTQAEAEAGVATTARAFTAQRVAQAIAALAPGGGGGSVSDVPFAGSWDSVTTIPPSKNAVYDKITAMDVAISSNASSLAGKQAALSTVVQVEAEAGVATTDRIWTALRVKQAILALSPGGGSTVVLHRRVTTTNANDVQIIAYGASADIAAITVVKSSNGVTLSTIPAGVRLISVQSFFSGADVGANTSVSISYPDPNGATTLAESILPTMTRYTTAFNPFGTQAGTIVNNAGVITATHSGGVVANNSAALKLVF